MRRMRTWQPKPRECVDRLVCDLCGKESDPARSNWETWAGDIQETTIEMRVGTCDHDGGGDSVTTRFDVCTECFAKKVVPALESLGAKPTVTEIQS